MSKDNSDTTPDERERDIARKRERYEQAFQVELAQARDSLHKRGAALTDDNIERELETLRWRRVFGTEPKHLKTRCR